MHPFVCILFFFFCYNRIFQNVGAINSTDDSTDGFGYREKQSNTETIWRHFDTLSAVGIPNSGLLSVLGIGKRFIEHLTSFQRMPDSIKTTFEELLPHIHLINRTENVTDGNLTTKCCGRYGCFTKEYPFGDTSCRPIALLPSCQDELKIRFFLWTRQNPISEDIIDPEDISTLLSSHFNEEACVVIHIHGYLGRGIMYTTLEMKNAILNKTDCNFITVDWMIGALVNYTKAVANGQVVSAVTAYFIQQITKHYNISLDKFHVIGSSLSAHIAGGVGKRIPGLGRITGLDPSKPFFEGCESTVHITRSDAMFVDIIHTDIALIGVSVPSGHLDIYVNGGSSQPPCFGFIGCDHPMALMYFIDSIKAECPYYAYQCDNFGDFMMGKCNVQCDQQGSLCAPMGYYADQWKRHARLSPTLMFMATGEEKPYCVYHYYVEIECLDNQTRVWRYGVNLDKLLINIIGEKGDTDFLYAHENSVQYTNFRITTMVTSNRRVGKIKSVKLRWIHERSYHKAAELPGDLCFTENTLTRDICTNYKGDDSTIGLCCSCPYQVTFVHVRNLETGLSKTFSGKRLRPFQDILFE